MSEARVWIADLKDIHPEGTGMSMIATNQPVVSKIDHDAAMKTLRDERDRLARAIVWALGYTDFRAREQGEGAYWWRTELRLRAKLTGEQIDAILAALTPAGGGKNEKQTGRD